MLTEYLTETPREWDRSNTVGSSEIGQCARKIAYLKQGLEPDSDYEDSWGMKERGHWVEAWAVERFRANGADVHEAGDDQVTRSDGFFSATPDGYFDKTSFDIKSFDPRKSRLPEPAHILQARIGARLNPKTNQAILVYINASDFEDQMEFGPFPEITDDELASLKARAREIMAKPADQHRREGFIAGDCSRLNCPFRERCIGDPIKNKGSLSSEDEGQLLKIQAEHAAVVERLETAERDKKQLQERVREIFQASDVKKMTNVASIRRDARDSLDTEAMARDGIDLAPYRKEGKPFDVITIRKPKGANAK